MILHSFLLRISDLNQIGFAEFVDHLFTRLSLLLKRIEKKYDNSLFKHMKQN